MARNKRIVICCDGTWNRPDEMSDGKPAPTNVYKLASAIARMDDRESHQIVYYHSGVGSEGNILDHVAGGAFGDGIDRIIEDIYRFLVLNFAPGDEIWLFGFSRGAYVARSTAGLIRNAGVLRPEKLACTPEALALYRSEDPEARPDGETATKFRADLSVETDIYFIGVWDTVGALGIPEHLLPLFDPAAHVINQRVSKYQFFDRVLSSRVRNAFHALAIDEHRKPFAPTVWESQDAPDQTLEQVWFPGVHSDIGGGYSDHGLSDLALRWMIDKAKSRGLCVNPVPEMNPSPTAAAHESLTLFFEVFGAIDRPITPGVAGQAIDESVSLRMAQTASYRPVNVAAALSKKASS